MYAVMYLISSGKHLLVNLFGSLLANQDTKPSDYIYVYIFEIFIHNYMFEDQL